MIIMDEDMEQELDISKRRRRMDEDMKLKTLPSSPCHSFASSSSSDFEFSISISPRNSSTADELFYKGQILPLHLSPRISMVRTIILSSSSTTSSSSTDTSNTNSASRDSTGSRSSNDSMYSINSDLLSFFPDCDSSRPSSVTEDEEFKRLHELAPILQTGRIHTQKRIKYFSLPRFSSVFRKELGKNRDLDNLSGSGSSVKGMRGTVRELIRKYLKKVKPLFEKLSQQKKPQHKINMGDGFCSESDISSSLETERSFGVQSESGVNRSTTRKNGVDSEFSESFSGNLRYPRRETCVSSCPSSMRSSPRHSGVLSRTGFCGGGMYGADSSSMEELQSAIQGAIAYCKNSMLPNKQSAMKSE